MQRTVKQTSSGVFTLELDFSGCRDYIDKLQQLLWYRYYAQSATPIKANFYRKGKVIHSWLQPGSILQIIKKADRFEAEFLCLVP